MLTMRGLDTELFLPFRPSHCGHDSLVVEFGLFSLFNKPILHSFWHSCLSVSILLAHGCRIETRDVS